MSDTVRSELERYCESVNDTHSATVDFTVATEYTWAEFQSKCDLALRMCDETPRGEDGIAYFGVEVIAAN